MAFTYSEFVSTPAGIVAAVKAAILASSNWSNPTGQVVQCTAANGATMALDLIGGGAADNQRIRTLAWRLYSGGVGTNSIQRSLYWARTAGTSGMTLRCRVAAGNTLLYIEIEGPRAGETSADSSTGGSFRQCIFLAQITPYLGSDTIPAIAFGGSSSYHGNESITFSVPNSVVTYVSRNQADNAPWVSGRLATLQFPIWQQALQAMSQRQLAADGSLYLSPYVVFEDSAGIRGRLTDLYFGGWNSSDDTVVTGNLADGMPLSYGGNTYKVTVPYRTDGSGSAQSSGSLAATVNQGTQYRSPLIVIRTA